MTRKLILLWAVVGGACLGVVALSMDVSRLQWSCLYSIRSPTPPSPSPDELRGIAFSTNGSHFYLGTYVYGGSGMMVLKVLNDLNATTANQFASNTVIRLTGYRGRAIATDDRGRVYLTDGLEAKTETYSVWWPTDGTPVTNYAEPPSLRKGINIFDSDLEHLLYSTNRVNCEGIAVRREGGVLAMYATDRSNKTVTRWRLYEDGEAITNAVPDGLDGDGEITIPGASEPRGMAVDANGRIWVACYGDGNVRRCDNDGSNWTNVACPSPLPLDVCCDAHYAYVSRRGTAENSGQVLVIDVNNMKIVANWDRPSSDVLVIDASNMNIVTNWDRPSSNITGVVNGTFMCLDKMPGGERIYVTLGMKSGGLSPSLAADSNWKPPVLPLDSPAVDGTVFRIR